MKKFILFTFLVFGFLFLSPELNAQTITCPEGDMYTCYSNSNTGVTVYKGRGNSTVVLNLQ